MATTQVLGRLCLIWSTEGWTRKRPYNLLPRREKWFYFRRGVHLWLLHWKPYHGIWLVAERRGDASAEPHTVTPRGERPVPIKKRPGQKNGDVKLPEARVTSVLLAKLPAIREWMVSTLYDDGTARVPGKLGIEVYGQTWVVTLRDPNNGLRLQARGDELDRTLLLLEQFLGVEEAPWEVDSYLTSQLAKKRKK